jgi:hypothetical protein
MSILVLDYLLLEKNKTEPLSRLSADAAAHCSRLWRGRVAKKARKVEADLEGVYSREAVAVGDEADLSGKTWQSLKAGFQQMGRSRTIRRNVTEPLSRLSDAAEKLG